MSEEARYPFVHLEVPTAEAELATDRFWELGAQGVEERDESTMNGSSGPGRTLLVASFAGEADAQRVATEVGGQVEVIVGDEWRDAWKEHFQITPIGDRLLLRPSWRDVPEDAGDRVVLTIDPGGAFGSGLHESTRLVLRAIEASVKGGESVFDVGCGSGILAIAALLLGAERAIGIDVEDSAVPTTLENAEINGVDDRLGASTDPIESVEGTYDLVLANIQAPILIGMAAELAKRVAEGGTLVMSGILEGQEQEVAAALTAELPGTEATITADGGWRAVTIR
ncbi:MAG: 50S ribosomal protein L11 methyltransferase [Deltaproteobacteria bacterium]|nr:50S ribosomal protein L11 methyltransferase [Deltaproteobacteria bacterium]